MATEKRETGVRLVALLDERTKDFAEALENSGINVKAFKRTALTTLQSNQDLMSSTQASVFTALLDCAQLGLIPDNKLGQAYLIGRKNNKKGVHG